MIIYWSRIFLSSSPLNLNKNKIVLIVVHSIKDLDYHLNYHPKLVLNSLTYHRNLKNIITKFKIILVFLTKHLSNIIQLYLKHAQHLFINLKINSIPKLKFLIKEDLKFHYNKNLIKVFHLLILNYNQRLYKQFKNTFNKNIIKYKKNKISKKWLSNAKIIIEK